MDKHETFIEHLIDATYRKQKIKSLRKAAKWSLVAAVAAMLAAFLAFFGENPGVAGIMMGVSAMNLVVYASNGNLLALALYIEKTEAKKISEQVAAGVGDQPPI